MLEKFSYITVRMGFCMLLLLIIIQARFYTLSSEFWSTVNYGKRFVETKQSAMKVASFLLPGEQIYNWGMETGFYFHTSSRLPSGSGWWMLSLNEGPLTEKLLERTKKELAQTSPELLIVSPYRDRWPLPEWLISQYKPFQDNRPFYPFKLYYLRGGAVESRVMAMVRGTSKK